MLTFGPDHTLRCAVSALAFKQGLIHTDVKALATDVGELSSKQALIHTDLHTDVKALATDVGELSSKLDSEANVNTQLANQLSICISKVNSMQDDLQQVKTSLEANAFATKIESMLQGLTDGVSALATKTDVGGLSSKQSLIHADVNTLATGVEALVENISLVGVALSYTWERGPGNPQDPGAPWGNGPWESMHVEGSNGSKLSVPIPSKWVGSEHRLQLDKRYTWTIRATGIVRENHGLRVQRKRWPSYTIDLDAIDLDSDTLTLAVGWGTGPLG